MCMYVCIYIIRAYTYMDPEGDVASVFAHKPRAFRPFSCELGTAGLGF